MGILKVISPGIYSTIQDGGRIRVSHLGIPKSGVIDEYASDFGKNLLGNNKNSAVLELSFKGGTFQFTEATQIVVCGATTRLMLNDSRVAMHELISVQPDDILKVGAITNGTRCYIAIKDGFQTEEILGSRSYYNPVTKQTRILRGDEIPYNSGKAVNTKPKRHVVFDDTYLNEQTLEVFRGPEFHLLSAQQQDMLFNKSFSVNSASNRMAFLFNEILENDLPSILTMPVLPGTVQLTPSGRIIVLMRDCQTTGGYPRILQLTQHALNVLGQKNFNSAVNFKETQFSITSS